MDFTVTLAGAGTDGWSDPAATMSNPYFTVDGAGWAHELLTPEWTWDAGRMVSPDVGAGPAVFGLTRSSLAGVLRPMHATSYRVQSRIHIPGPAIVWTFLEFGATAVAAAQGPGWWPGAALRRTRYTGLRSPGWHTIESIFDDLAAIPPELGYIGATVHIYCYAGDDLGPVMIDTHALSYAAGDPYDATCLVETIDISHGRDGPTSQPDASTATLALDLQDASVPDLIDIGTWISIDINTELDGEPVTSRRFAGRITDITAGWDEAGESTPDAARARIIAAGTLADLGRRIIGDVPWPVELDGHRVTRILEAAGITVSPAFTDPGTVAVLARDVDAQPALDLAHEIAASASGILWATRSGDIRYADADHRRGTPPSLALDTCQILAAPAWSRTTDGLVNHVSIGYGEPDEESGDQARHIATDPASITRYGRYGQSFATVLAEEADAIALATLMLTRASAPVWILEQLPLDAATLDEGTYATLLGLDIHDLITLTGLPAIAGTPTSAALWVEGWSEHLAHDTHTIELVVSGYCRTSAAPRWVDLTPEQTWALLDPDLTWTGASCLGPPVNLGRWSDTPATLRWTHIDPDTDWTEWSTT